MLTNEKEQKIDPRIKRTRKLLQQAFNELIQEKDFHSISVHDIADRAEVNRATFYAHFEDKYALLSYSVQAALQALLEERLPNMQMFTATNLRLLAVTVCEFMNQFYGHCHPGSRNDEQLTIGAQVQQYICKVILDWLTQSSAPSAEPIAAGLSWIIFGTAVEAARSNSKESPEELADQILGFLLPSVHPYFVEVIA